MIQSMQIVRITSSKREEMIDITDAVTKCLAGSGAADGICVVFSQHTTCGVTVNVNADQEVQSDML
jgi:secondary thiamine-phosphate synthase enzyme